MQKKKKSFDLDIQIYDAYHITIVLYEYGSWMPFFFFWKNKYKLNDQSFPNTHEPKTKIVIECPTNARTCITKSK